MDPPFILIFKYYIYCYFYYFYKIFFCNEEEHNKDEKILFLHDSALITTNDSTMTNE